MTARTRAHAASAYLSLDDLDRFLAELDYVDHDQHVRDWERASQQNAHVATRTTWILDSLDDPSEIAKVSANQTPADSAQTLAAQGFTSNANDQTLVTSYTPSSTSLLSRLRASTNKSTSRLHAPANQNLKSWERLSEAEKLVAIGEWAEARGAIAITVHMNARKQTTIRRAAAAGRDICQILADDIARTVRKLGLKAPEILFGIEVAPVTNKIHIHGFYLPAGDTSAYFDPVREASTHALGKISGQSGSTQFHAQELYDETGWFTYFQKHTGRARKHLGVQKLVYVSNSLRRSTKAAHEARRPKAQKTAPVRKPTTKPTKISPAFFASTSLSRMSGELQVASGHDLVLFSGLNSLFVVPEEFTSSLITVRKRQGVTQIAQGARRRAPALRHSSRVSARPGRSLSLWRHIPYSTDPPAHLLCRSTCPSGTVARGERAG